MGAMSAIHLLYLFICYLRLSCNSHYFVENHLILACIFTPVSSYFLFFISFIINIL